MPQAQIRKVLAVAEETAQRTKYDLPRDFRPRLARYAGELLRERVHLDDVIHATQRVVEGQHSPYLVKAFVANRLSPSLGKSTRSTLDEALTDFPDYLS